MANKKFYQVEKEINGVKYTAQFSGLSAWLRCTDAAKQDNGSDDPSNIRIYEKVLEAGLVEPKGLTVDDFDDMDNLDAVFKFVSNVMKGKFRTQTEKKGTEAKS